MDSLIKPLVYIFGIIGACSTATVMVVFYWRRETPTVRSSDYQLSMVHLSSLTTTYNVGLSNFVNLSNEMCVVRNLNISIFYCLLLLYTQGQGILDVFKLKVRASAGEIRKTIATEVFTIPFLLLTANLLLCVLYSIREPRIDSWEVSDKWHRIHYCNATYHQT